MDTRTPEHQMAQFMLDVGTRPRPALWSPGLQREYADALNVALRALVDQARGGDEFVSGSDLEVRVGALVLDRVGR